MVVRPTNAISFDVLVHQNHNLVRSRGYLWSNRTRKDSRKGTSHASRLRRQAGLNA